VRISLISTLLNEAAGLKEMLAAVDGQTRAPDEVVIVDGGSTDGSLEILQGWADGRPEIRIESRRGANISAGRNAAIRLATGDVIAVTDFGCTLDPEWLAALAAGFEGGADVVMGFYAPDPRSRFERVVACLNLPDASEVDPDKFMPSSRSVAFRKTVWEKAGGYPEWLAIGEDMYFNFRVLDTGARRVFAPGALVHWRLRPDLRSTLRQYFRYGEGDGRAGMYPKRHALRFGTYAGAAGFLAVASRRPALLALVPVAVGVRMAPAYRRAFKRLDAAEAALALAVLPVLEMLIDLAKMAGYVSGRIAGQPVQPRATPYS
jgi:glycosyltransferase involved in cell wall biosynthesis